MLHLSPMKSFQDIIVAKSIKDVVERGFHLSRKRSITNFTFALLNKKTAGQQLYRKILYASKHVIHEPPSKALLCAAQK